MPCSSRVHFKHLVLNQVGQSPAYSVLNLSKDRDGTGSLGPHSRQHHSYGDFFPFKCNFVINCVIAC